MPMSRKPIYYIAHPYTPHDGITVEENLRLCNERCNKLLDLGYIIFSPITHSHQLHILQERPYEFWLEQDLAILPNFDGIILCPNWKMSKGCKLEFDLAKKEGLEILFYEFIIGGQVACRS